MKQPPSLRALIIDLVCSRSQIPIKEIVAALGCHISAAKAASAKGVKVGIHASVARRVQVGKRYIISYTLSVLYRKGKISRFGSGVYGPPPPKIFQEPLSASYQGLVLVPATFICKKGGSDECPGGSTSRICPNG